MKPDKVNPVNVSIQYFKGIGPQRAKLFTRLGIHTVYDLVHYFPNRWEDRTNIRPIGTIQPGESVTITGTIKYVNTIRTRAKLTIFRATVFDDSGIIYATWYRRYSYRYDVFTGLKKKILPGKKIIIYGTVRLSSPYPELQVTEYELPGLEPETIHPSGKIIPIYSLTEGIEPQFYRKLIYHALTQYKSIFNEIVPEKVRLQYKLCTYNDALLNIHFPTDWQKKEQAYHTLSFTELLLYQLVLELQRKKIKQTTKPYTYTLNRTLLTPFRNNLKIHISPEFDFTAAQKRVVKEIFTDLMSPYPMNRLLQGDVGSGKTVVAICAMLLAVENRYQTMLMVPTEILAEQHYITFRRLLAGLPVQVAVLTGKTTPKEKDQIRTDLQSGKITILIGTHSLLEEKIVLPNLRLIIIDEQHRFGVMQRAKLRTKNSFTDVLVMTATPIPRTLALTMYGDLDVSVIDELPPGRQQIITRHVNTDYAFDYIKSTVREGSQGYVVYPLVEESDKLALKSAVKEAYRLTKEVFPEFKVGLIHGQLKTQDKEDTMYKFYTGQYQILVATTVIEVGIDVPNATVIAIEHSERFGLATLHQLRGRVGRGTKQAYCFLLGTAKTEDAKRRIKVMEKTNNGFIIAEEDLNIRGPGEFFGTAQHGELMFKLVDLIKDKDIIRETLDTAREILNHDPKLSFPEHRNLRLELIRQYKDKVSLLKIG